jgi:predicted enzyme related to lactoylglutathione lyase
MATVTSQDPGTFCWIELATSDATAAKAFYAGVFGWTAKDIPMGEHGFYTMLQNDGRDAGALYENKQMPPNWLSYVAVESVDDTIKTAKDLGANVMAGPMDVFESGRMAVLTDPQGAHFAVWEPKKHIGIGVFGESNSLVWNELATSDEEAARTFYTSLFGWTTKTDSSSPMQYTEIHAGERGIGGMYKLKPEMQGVPPNWIPYIAVDDCDATVAKTTELGGSVMMPPMDIPGIGRFAVIKDPQGAAISIIKTEPRA